MSVFSRLFSGFGSNRKATNGKFNTTKNNHNVDKYNRPTVIFAYSRKHLKRWLGVDRYKTAVKKANTRPNLDIALYNILLKENPNNFPSYLNPIYRGAYYQSKHRR